MTENNFPDGISAVKSNEIRNRNNIDKEGVATEVTPAAGVDDNTIPSDFAKFHSEEASDRTAHDGGDSDVDGEEFEIFDSSYVKACIKDASDDTSVHVNEISNGNIAFVISDKGVVTEAEQNLDFDTKVIKPPEDWVRPAKKNGDEPNFEDLDNPGKWSDFIFRPVYDKKNKYLRHELPTGCTPVPIDKETGKRIQNGWEFFYNGWKSSLNPEIRNIRNGATPHNIFPAERKGSLDGDLLKKLGLTINRMRDRYFLPDALFFYQLILPICDPSKSGIENDPRKPFYTNVTHLSNLYKHQQQFGNIYGHHISEAAVQEFLRWDGIIVRDGIRGGTNGALYRRWMTDTACYDKYVCDAMSYERWVQLKRIYKLNNNDTAKKRGEEGYNPASKYDLIYDVITSNVRALTKYADLDLTGDETTWGFQGYAERGAKVVYRIQGKPGVSKGGQTVIVSAVNRIRPYWYQHRHAFTKRYGRPGFTAEGPSEVRSCIDALAKMVRNSPSDEKKIFSVPPHITFDNYFSGEEVCHYAGRNGFGLTTTCRRDRLPKGIKNEYMHKKKTDTINDRTKCARFIDPLILVRSEQNYEVVLTSFQSTSSCNIMSVNAFGENKNYIEARVRGRGSNRCPFVIEQNFARQLYLKTYSWIDSIDHLIKSANIKYRSWKYWHSAVNHAKGLALTVAYDIYKECCEGKLHCSWTISDPVDFFTFQDVLSRQMCQYDPRKQHYPGDEKMRMVTSLTKRKRASHAHGISKAIKMHSNNKQGTISFQQYKKAMQARPHRICDSLAVYEKHVDSYTHSKNPARCAVCGFNSYKRCTICGVALHDNDTKGAAKGKKCALHWHSKPYVGLCFEDRKIMGVSVNDWRGWTKKQLKDNTDVVRGYE